ncbi:MAG: adenosylmethionine decarboxylase [Chloroflexi bacterium]|nr:adenosylmethionine decarboxylase [Chloroflexota bacterium]
MHLVIDGYGGDAEKLQDKDLIYHILDSYPAQIDMTKISAPVVFRYVGPKPEDWGISGFVIIAESHISIHTFPERAYVNIDIFSCKGFDTDRAMMDLQSWFGLKEIRCQLLERGLEYPHHLEVAASMVKEERRDTVALRSYRLPQFSP